MANLIELIQKSSSPNDGTRELEFKVFNKVLIKIKYFFDFEPKIAVKIDQQEETVISLKRDPEALFTYPICDPLEVEEIKDEKFDIYKEVVTLESWDKFRQGISKCYWTLEIKQRSFLEETEEVDERGYNVLNRYQEVTIELFYFSERTCEQEVLIKSSFRN